MTRRNRRGDRRENEGEERREREGEKKGRRGSNECLPQKYYIERNEWQALLREQKRYQLRCVRMRMCVVCVFVCAHGVRVRCAFEFVCSCACACVPDTLLSLLAGLPQFFFYALMAASQWQ